MIIKVNDRNIKVNNPHNPYNPHNPQRNPFDKFNKSATIMTIYAKQTINKIQRFQYNTANNSSVAGLIGGFDFNTLVFVSGRNHPTRPAIDIAAHYKFFEELIVTAY